MDWGKEDKKSYRVAFPLILFLLVSCSYGGVHSHRDILHERNDYSTVESLENLNKEYFLYNYQSGIFHFNNNSYDSALVSFENADRYRRERFNENTIKKIETVFLNTASSQYFGEDYEDLMINFYKSAIYAKKGDFENSAVESRIISQKLKLFKKLYFDIDSSFNYYTDYPFFEALSGIFYLFNSDFQDAYISFKMADSLYSSTNFKVSKPQNLGRLIDAARYEGQNDSSGFTLKNLKVIIFQYGQMPDKVRVDDYINIQLPNRFYQLKFSYPMLRREYSNCNSITISTNLRNIESGCQISLSEMAYRIHSDKIASIIGITTMQAYLKLAVALGSDLTAQKVTEAILEKKREDDKKKSKNGKPGDGLSDDEIKMFADIAGCITGFTVNQSLNSITKADIRQVKNMPAYIVLLPVILNEGENLDCIIYRGKRFQLNSDAVQFINAF